MSLRSALVSSLLALSLVACDKKAEAPAAVTAQAPKAAETKQPAVCVAPAKAGPAKALTLAGKSWELAGSTLTLKDASDSLVVGAVTDIKEDSAENKKNLEQFAQWFKEKKADVIVVAGDTGETAAQIESALSILAETQLPVFSIIGNREGRQAYGEAIAALQKKYPNVFDLNQVRRVDTGAVDIVSLPGYFNANYIHAADGCQYSEADVAALAEIVKTANSPVLLVSHGGPKQEGAEALDRTSEGDNVGDPALTKLIADLKIAFGIFGNIHEAGGRATDLSGKTVVAQNVEASSLFLNPGPADAVRWMLNDKSESLGMAGLLTVSGGKAKYEIKRASPAAVAEK